MDYAIPTDVCVEPAGDARGGDTTGRVASALVADMAVALSMSEEGLNGGTVGGVVGEGTPRNVCVCICVDA